MVIVRTRKQTKLQNCGPVVADPYHEVAERKPEPLRLSDVVWRASKAVELADSLTARSERAKVRP